MSDVLFQTSLKESRDSKLKYRRTPPVATGDGKIARERRENLAKAMSSAGSDDPVRP